MAELDSWMWALLAVAVAGGLWSVWCVRGGKETGRTRWGQRLFVGCLLTLGVGNLVALTCAARCLMPFGLSAGWLVIAMLWENPFRGGLRP